jgi:carboxymethylenebutenolidase
MIDRKSVRSTFVLMLLASFPACDKAPSPTAAEQDAARANVDAMAREHAEDSAQPSPAAQVAPGGEVMGERMAYAEVNDELVYGYFAFPAEMLEPLPAIIMIHEWWGLNENIRAMAERLAAEGYMVLAVDLFGGETAEDPQTARQLMLGAVENPQFASSNIQQAYSFIEKAGAPGIASLGWCFGGGWSLNTAMLFPDDLDAAVIYYGRVTADEDKLRPLNVPILGFFGAEDKGISVESVKEFEQSLKRLRKEHVLHIYPGAGHAFANPTGNTYKPEYANDAWQKSLAFLKAKLAQDEL